MSDRKTTQTDANVQAFLDEIAHERKRRDSIEMVRLMQDVTGLVPKMWGTSIVGFGSYHYRYESGREGDSPLIGFSPRKQNLTLYIMSGVDNYPELLADLGKHRTGKVCVYINKLDDVHIPTLRKLIKRSVTDVINANP